MEEIKQASNPQEAFEAALQWAIRKLSPERALVLFGQDEQGDPIVKAAHGVDAATVLLTGDISLETLRHVVRTGEPLELIDAMQSDYADRNSVVLAGLRSVVCVPVTDPEGDIVGLIYADNRLRAGAFGEEHVELLQEVSTNLAARLAELN